MKPRKLTTEEQIAAIRKANPRLGKSLVKIIESLYRKVTPKSQPPR
jgi:hypothetical protein